MVPGVAVVTSDHSTTVILPSASWTYPDFISIGILKYPPKILHKNGTYQKKFKLFNNTRFSRCILSDFGSNLTKQSQYFFVCDCMIYDDDDDISYLKRIRNPKKTTVLKQVYTTGLFTEFAKEIGKGLQKLPVCLENNTPTLMEDIKTKNALYQIVFNLHLKWEKLWSI